MSATASKRNVRSDTMPSSTTDARRAAATRHMQSGAYRAALQIYETLLEETPDDADLLNDAALAYYQDDHANKAERYLRRAVEAQPDHQAALFNLLDLLIEQNNDLAAAKVFDKYVENIPDGPDKDQYAKSLASCSSGRGIVQNRQITKDKTHLIICTQRRSGSTIFWKTIRQDERFVCYDEPLSLNLRHHVELGKDHPKEVFKEYLEIPELIRTHWSSVQPTEEPYSRLINHQETYLRALLKTGDHVCMDFVRCNSKIDHLREIAPTALIVHLIRDPRSWVTSHLRPYGNWLPGLPEAFFSHQGWFDYWTRQRLARHLDIKGPAHQQLLQLWARFTEAAEASSPDLTIQFEYFAQHPASVIECIYQFMDLEYIPLDYSSIHPPNPPYALSHPAWEKSIHNFLPPKLHNYLYPFDQISHQNINSI